MVVTGCRKTGSRLLANPVGAIFHRRSMQFWHADGVPVIRSNVAASRKPESARVRREYMALRADSAVAGPPA